MSARLVAISDVEAGQRLDRWLQRAVPGLTFGDANRWIRTGQTRINGKRAKANSRLAPGDEVRLPPQADAVQAQALERQSADENVLSKSDRQMVASMILFEDDDMLVLNKPAGLAVQGGSKQLKHLDGLLRGYFQNRADPKLVHRLDRETSGVLLVAKHSIAAARLSKAFRDDTTDKRYRAIVEGAPPKEGEIDAALIKKANAGKGGGESIQVDDAHGKSALTKFVCLHKSKTLAALELKPITGRTHQLRVHCQYKGWPILGDRKYGSRVKPVGVENRLYLHAERITLPDPATGRLVSFSAPLPEAFGQAYKKQGWEQDW